MSEKIKHATDASYQQDVLEAELPVVVDFWAPWCGPCRSLAPIFEQLAEDYEGKLQFVKINTDENQAVPGKLGIRGIPTMIVYMGGEEVDRLVGFAPKAVLAKRFDAILASAKEA